MGLRVIEKIVYEDAKNAFCSGKIDVIVFECLHHVIGTDKASGLTTVTHRYLECMVMVTSKALAHRLQQELGYELRGKKPCQYLHLYVKKGAEEVGEELSMLSAE